MAKFLFVYYGGMGETTPAEQKKVMDLWTKWFAKLGKAVVDGGAPTKPGKMVSKDGTRSIANPLAGYSIIQASNLDEAVDMAKSHPNIPDGIQIAVYEFLPMA